MTTLCPDTSRLTALLDGRLTDAEQIELHQHIDTCERCQQTLESLVAGKESWDGIARRLANADRPANPALHDVMDAAKDMSKTFVTPTDFPADLDLPLTFLQPSDVPDSLGRLAHYEILSVVGRGGMGIVLKALDTSLRRVVAIKVMSPHLAANASARRRFVREAQAAAAVAHEHVVAIHAVADQHQPPFLAMQFIEGKTLQERLDKFGSLSTREVLRIGMQTAAGLAAAHAQGLVHRDIKPANILLENGVERVKLTDFGLARAVDDASVTQSGVIAGTPQYMSPEQARGEVVDHRSDLFSLGCVLYAMCVGHAPFRASTTMGVLKRVCEDAPRPIREMNPDIPEWLATIVAKLLAKNPADRFQTAKEVGDVLGQSLAHIQQPTIVPMPPRALPPAWITEGGYSTPASPDQTPIAVLPERPSLNEWLARFAMLPLTVCGVVLLTGAPALIQMGTEYQWAMLGCAAALLLLMFFLLAYLLQATNRRRARAAGTVRSALATSSGLAEAGSASQSHLPRQPDVEMSQRLAAQLSGDAVRSTHPTPSPPVKRRWWKFALVAAAIAFCVLRFGPSLVLTARNQGRLSVELYDPQAKLVLRRGGDIVAEHLHMDSRWTTVRPLRGGEMRTVTDKGPATLDLIPGTYHVEIVPPPGRVVDRLYYSHATLFTNHSVPHQAIMEKELYVGRGDFVTLFATFKNSTPKSHPDFQSLQGRWIVVLQETNGKALVDGGRRPVSLVYDGDQARQVESHDFPPYVQIASDSFVINPNVSPKEIDQAWTGRGIYELDGDTLTLCLASSSPERPKTFDSRATPNTTLTVLKRAEPDEQRLQGRWRVVSQEAQGQSIAGPSRVEWVEFSRNVFGMKVGGTETITERLFELNPATKMRQIDLFGTQDRAHEGTGIYRLDGDTLTLCIGPHQQPRPTEFSNNSAPGLVVTVLQREKETNSDRPRPSTVAAADAANLSGTWIGVAGERNGGAVLPSEMLSEMKLAFVGDRVQVTMPGGLQGGEGTFKLDTTQQPKRMAITRAEGPNRFAVMDGIYELNGDHLRIAMGEPEDKITDFQSRAGTRILVADFVRRGAVGPISFESTTGSLIAAGTLVIDRDGTFPVPFPRAFAAAPLFVFPTERYTGPGRLSVRRSESSFTIEASEMNVDAQRPARLGWLASGTPGPEPSDSAATVWADGGEGWSVGVGWTSGETKLVVGPNESSATAAFQVMLRNNTDQPLTLSLPELPSWDLTTQSQRRLKVRLHEQDKLNIALAPREQKVLGLPKPQLDLTDLESGNWHVSFATPFVKQPLLLELTLVAPRPKWLTPAVEQRQISEHSDAEFKDVSWGSGLQGLRLGVRLKSDPVDAVTSSDHQLRWLAGRAVKLVPEFFLWNTTESDVEVSMLHHTPLDWIHRIRKSSGPEVGPHPILTGPKIDERHRLKPGEAIRLGDSTLHIGPPEGNQANKVRLDPGEYSYASFLNLHRADLSHINLHLESGDVKLLIEKAETNKPTP